MKKMILAVALCAGFLAAPVRAQEYKTVLGSQDLNLIMGYKMWLNNWASWNTGASGTNFVEVSQGGLANIFNMVLRYKSFFTGFGFLFTPEYTFPTYTDHDGTANRTIGMKASRNEIDWNVGYMVVPQLGFTAGLKTVQQKWKFSQNNVAGGAFGATTTWNWIGPTLGILGSAPIGNGFSLYGNGAGGIMSVSTTPSNTRNDSATYESAELGLAWRAKEIPLSASFGYKFQRLTTKFNAAGYTDQRGLDLTSGYVLGLNLIF
jgi:hypothetical protein